jgi:nucleotide-binding universal stress UspA family protein
MCVDTFASELRLDMSPAPAPACAGPWAPADRDEPRPGILAIVDAGPGGSNAAWRAALVARDHGRPLHLASIQPHPADALAVRPMLQELAGQLQRRVQVRAHPQAAAGEWRECVTALAAGKDLVVVAHQASASWADKVLGTLPERMLRWLAVPVLVVRRPATSGYRRVLACVKLDEEAERQIAAARAMTRGRKLRVLHVLEPGPEGSMRLADVSDHAVSLHRQRRLERAHAQVDALLDRTGAAAQGATAVIALGHVSRRVLDAARGQHAQLIVAGTGRRSMWGDVLRGGLVQDLLRGADADLLVLPLRHGRA